MFRGRASATERPGGNALDMQIQSEVRAAFAHVHMFPLLTETSISHSTYNKTSMMRDYLQFKTVTMHAKQMECNISNFNVRLNIKKSCTDMTP